MASLNPSSTITAIGNTNKNTFLLVGGTNFLNPSVIWNPYQTYRFIFNYRINQQTAITLNGKLPGTPTVNKINKILQDGFTTQKTYLCGNFSITTTSSGVANNIAFFQNASWFSMGLSFSGTNIMVTNMIFNETTRAPTLLYITGKFNSVTSSGGTSNAANFAIINLANNQVITTTTGPVGSYQLNSLTKIGNFIYAGGTTAETGGNAFLAVYNITSNSWTTLSSTFSGNINVINQISPTSPIIAIGGQFTSLETATDCNNIVFYNTSTLAYTTLGTVGSFGVSGVAAVNAPYAQAQVFTISSLTIAGVIYLYVGGYFVNAGGNLCNSIAIYKNSTNEWFPYVRSGITGVLYNNYITKTTNEPGIVYSIIIAAQDNSNIIIGGLFVVALTPSTPTAYTYNIFRITTSETIPKAYNQYYGKTITV